ncbi:MAG TPA: hypothetical protein VGK70_10085, partial [Thermoanaerobaculia bacterium]
YRLKDEESDLAILGLPESVRDAPVAVEWPGQAIRKLLPPTIEVTIEPRSDGTRSITIGRGRSLGEQRPREFKDRA